jgi:hypothetical protein
MTFAFISLKNTSHILSKPWLSICNIFSMKKWLVHCFSILKNGYTLYIVTNRSTKILKECVLYWNFLTKVQYYNLEFLKK